jgi:hypothetical protein
MKNTLQSEEIQTFFLKNVGFNFFFTFCDPSGQPH